MRTPLAFLMALVCAAAAQAATLEVRLFTVNQFPTETAFDEWTTHEIDGPTTLTIESGPRPMWVQWDFPCCLGYSAIIAGYDMATIHLTLEVDEGARAGTLSAWITAPADTSPGRVTWWAAPVSTSFALDAEGLWAWRLPDPSLIPDSSGTKTNPANILVALRGPAGAVPEPSALWLLWLVAMAWSARSVRGR